MSRTEQDSEASQSVAQSLHQSTQLLSQAAEHLDPHPSPAVPAADTPSIGLPRAASNNSQSASGLRECLDSLRSSRGGSNSRSLRLTSGFSPSTASTSAQFQPLRHTRRLSKKRPYHTKKWQHVFVCLSQVGQFMPPDTTERVRLAQA